MSAPPPAREDEPRASLQRLAERALRGERDAFDELHRRLRGGVRRLLSQRLNDEHVIDDLAQRTWAEVWRAFCEGRYDPRRAAISTYVYGTAYRVWQRHLQSVSRPIGALDALDEAQLGVEDDPASFLLAIEQLDALRVCLRALSADERAVVEGLSAGETERELAMRLGAAASTIHARKIMSYRKLRQCMLKKGFAIGDDAQGEGKGE
jgi:RNA polymerase sigma factor (sigma-70 family)